LLEEKTIPVGQGYVGKAAERREFINIPFDLYQDPDSEKSKETDLQTGYRTCSLMCMPIVSFEQKLVGVLQLINKRKLGVPVEYDSQSDLISNPPECFQAEFTPEDEKRMKALNAQMANVIVESQKSLADKGDDLLHDFLNKITGLAKEELRSDRVTIFLFDEDNKEFWSIIEEKDEKEAIEIRVPKNQGIVGEAAQKKPGEFVKVRDFIHDSRSTIAKQQAERTGYPTYNILAIPIFNDKNKLLAVVEFLNKLKFSTKRHDSNIPLEDRIDHQGFNDADPIKFDGIYDTIIKFLEGFKCLYETTRRRQRQLRLDEAIRSVSESHVDTFVTVKNAAQKLVDADRSTLWIYDRKKDLLWAQFEEDSEKRKVRLGVGYAGRAADNRQFLNIPFDLYNDDPGSKTSKETDQKTGYRTCSLICMPVLNSDGDLVGVIQLVNKKKPGKFPQYNHQNWPQAPECFQASFTDADVNLLHAFNSVAGTSLYRIELVEEIQHQVESLDSQI